MGQPEGVRGRNRFPDGCQAWVRQAVQVKLIRLATVVRMLRRDEFDSYWATHIVRYADGTEEPVPDSRMRLHEPLDQGASEARG